MSVRVSLGSEVKRFPGAVRVPATATQLDSIRLDSVLSRLAAILNFRARSHHVT